MLCGPNVINDVQVKRVIDKSNLKLNIDYRFADLGQKMIIIPEWRAEMGAGFYKYQKVPPSVKYPAIGRYYSKEDHTITDVVFRLDRDSHGCVNKFNDENPPFTIGWDYCLNYTSVSNVTMSLVNRIKDPLKRRNPLYVATFIAANLDSNNSDFGIMEGNWSITEFLPEECPSVWRDSGMICRKYLNGERKPVKYAQCWVFAELLTGMLRFLGIMSRTVKIHNCHIDIHNVGGVDVFDSDVKMKSGEAGSFDLSSATIPEAPYEGAINISKHIKSDFQVLYRNDEDLDTDAEKGYLFKSDQFLSLRNQEDLMCLNYFTKEGRSWNFHVWTEVCVNKKWWVLDPSPISDYKYYDQGCEYDSCTSMEDVKFPFSPAMPSDISSITFSGTSSTANGSVNQCRYEEFKGKKFFGPTEIEAIKNNHGKGNSFRYLQAAVNGPLRYWNVFFVEVNTPQSDTDAKDSTSSSPVRPVFYLKNVIYNTSRVVGKNQNGEIIDRTIDYRHREKDKPDDYYCLHRYNPVFLYIDKIISSFKELKIKYRQPPPMYIHGSSTPMSGLLAPPTSGLLSVLNSGPLAVFSSGPLAPITSPAMLSPLNSTVSGSLFYPGTLPPLMGFDSSGAGSAAGSKGYLIQTCLFFKDTLLVCHRYKTMNLHGVVKQNLAIEDDSRANKLTIVIYCLDTQRWWSQMIRL